MRPFLCATLIALSCCAHAQTVIPQTIILYKSAGQPLPQQIKPQWLPPANAYTAITSLAYFDRLKGNRLHSAEAQIVWAANSESANTGTAVLICPPQLGAGRELKGCGALAWFAANNSGAAPYTPGCVSNPTGGPFWCRVDVTEALQRLIDSGQHPMYYAGAAYGNGTTGPLIYAIEIYVHWLVP